LEEITLEKPLGDGTALIRCGKRKDFSFDAIISHYTANL